MIHEFFLTEWFFDLLRWLYSVLGNSYFLAIFVTTLALRLIQILPDISSRKSQRKQAALQPELEKLQKRYQDNPQKLNQEQSKLMKENGVNMLSGCLPMLLTLPIFFCFLAAFRFWGYEQTLKLTYETIISEQQLAAHAEVIDWENGNSDDNWAKWENTIAAKTYESFRFLWITNIWQPDNGFKPVVSTASDVKKYPKIENLVLFHKGYTDLDGNTVAGEDIWQTFVDNGIAEGEFGSENMKLLPSSEAETKYDKLMSLYKRGYNNGLFILPILAAGFQLLAAWLPQRKQKKENPNAAQAAKSMNFMMWLFPAMSFYFCLTATSAFALYWVLSSVFTVASSAIINAILDKKPVVLTPKKQEERVNPRHYYSKKK